MRNFLLIVLFTLIFIFQGPKIVRAQTQNFKSQFTLITDNDMYIDPNHDRYYSDGTYFNFTYAVNGENISNSNILKKTVEFEFGQKIYTGLSGHIYLPYHIDRPFTGYLFANGAINWLYKDEDALKFTAEIGTIGPAALGEEVQSGFHQLFGLYKVVGGKNYAKIGGWSHQLNTEPGLNLRLDYKHLLYRNDGNWCDVAVNPDAWLGNTFTGASAGVQLRIGDLNKFYQSVITNSRVSSNKREQINHEFYFFTLPQINYVAYDATIEGGLFRHDKGPVTFGIYHFVYQQQFGLQFASARWSASAIAYIKSREVKSTALGDQWGSIGIAYRFGKI
jgi:lipid A 3-O-deacylase